MRVVLNSEILKRGYSGTASVTRSIAAALTNQPTLDLIQAQSESDRSTSRFRNALKGASWDLWGAGRAVEAPDLLISPCNIGRAPRGVPHLLVMQDTMVLDHPALFDPWYVRYAQALFGLSAKGATRILTASEHAASSIRRHWRSLPPISVLGWPAPASTTATVRRPGPPPFRVVMVGATEPHKNHVGGIEAVRLARLMTRKPIVLAIIGPKGRSESQVTSVTRLADPMGEWIERIESPSDARVKLAYQEAWVLLQPSMDEGFGLPVLEAGSCALPVVHSGAGSLSAVHPSGDAGGPDPVKLADGLHRLVDSADYQAASAASLEVAANHSADDFARGLLRIILRTAT